MVVIAKTFSEFKRIHNYP